MYLFFDTETTGFKGVTPNRMTQLAFILTDEKGLILDEFESLIKPDGWIIPKEEFFIENNMSNERCELYGLDAFTVLRKFQEALKRAKYKIAHNLSFDNRIVLSEIINYGITPELCKFKKGYCTMKETRQLVKALDKNNRIKNPNLTNLYYHLFKEVFEDAHDAFADVKALMKCFFELKERGLIKLQ